jgi:hypothetical protein
MPVILDRDNSDISLDPGVTNVEGVSENIEAARKVPFPLPKGLWIGTVGQGLVHVHENRVDTFTNADGLSSNTTCFGVRL